ncbi:signal peptidase II [Patescibacteria group bacterium]|nr:signal peptidase II [Patescibacteria group bacterium]MBU1703565.1 signal peptidase II [Patescibacteria group bacterium]
MAMKKKFPFTDWYALNSGQSITLIAALALAIMDQLAKWLAYTQLAAPLRFTSWFSLQYTENTGVAFSLPIPHFIIIPLTITVLAGLIYFGAHHIKIWSPLAIIAIALIIGGALGNLYDRLAHGFVIDFIKVGWWPTFNLADAFLTAGIFLAVAFYGKIKKA